VNSPKKGETKFGKKKRETIDGAHDFIPPPPSMPGDDFAMPVREVVKPSNQLQLTDAELSEEIARMLTADNPVAPKKLVRFNMKERTYKLEPMVEQTIVHYATDGWLLNKGSEDAKKQMDMERMEQEASIRFQMEVERSQMESMRSHTFEQGEGGNDGPDDSKQLRNQFNFSERAAQTTYHALRDRETYTEPPPKANVSGSCSQWEIYDEYKKDLERQDLESTLKSKGAKKPAGPTGQTSAESDGKASEVSGADMGHSVKIVDRMISQNLFEEVAMDFKYWEDVADAYRPGEGTLLPLWRFTSEKAKRRQVTAICWSPLYDDLFAVGYGSYEFLKQTSGLICIFSLKNPTSPEFTFTTDSGVMSLHFHPEYSNLLAVGCYDGTVLVYDIHTGLDQPIYRATVQTGKHQDPVWQIFWQVDETQKVLQFVSISSDGNVNLWTMNKSELTHESLMKLKVVHATNGAAAETEEDSSVSTSTAGGCCMDFCKGNGQDHIYLVGTEEGVIHKCSKAYSSQYLGTYMAHHLAIYAVKWNYIHHGVFLSASADWTVKLWDSTQPSGSSLIMSFDLKDSVGDIAWAPYSSTVFAATTDDGKVHVFDLNENKLLPICSQKVIKKGKLTKIVFNPRHPILLVGDDKGTVTSLKLSPNLRRVSKPEKGQVFEVLEVAKLNQVIEVARKSEAA